MPQSSAQYLQNDNVLEDESLRLFARDIEKGLTQSQKYIPCIYFYNERGSQLFEQICRLPEYYPTRAEADILHNHSNEIAQYFDDRTTIIELGSGSSIKTRILLQAFNEKYKNINYVPIDISEEILLDNAEQIENEFDRITVNGIPARYEDGVRQINQVDNSKKLILWLGSSIGNFSRKQAEDFINQIRRETGTHDRFLIGIDLRKDRVILEAAYNDSQGVTAEFNLNVLQRINDELGGTFNLDRFYHRAVFNEELGRVEMYLISKENQIIPVKALDLNISFEEGEVIHTENSYKYSLDEIKVFAEKTGLVLESQWFDTDRKFSLNLFKQNSY